LMMKSNAGAPQHFQGSEMKTLELTIRENSELG